jgi:hypothetical protein
MTREQPVELKFREKEIMPDDPPSGSDVGATGLVVVSPSCYPRSTVSEGM